MRAKPDALPPTRTVHAAWAFALACFVLAAATGAWMRFGMLHGLPAGLRFDDVRHAHSHLMFFGWVTPALIAFMAAALSRSGMRIPGLRWLLGGTFLAALAAYLPFLLSGYRQMEIFGRDLPLSMMASGLNGLAWVAWIVLYLVATSRDSQTSGRGTTRSALPWFDAAVFLLGMSTLGIAGLAATGASGLMEPHLTAGLVDFFLTLFGEGWFAAGIVGLAYAAPFARTNEPRTNRARTDDSRTSRMLGFRGHRFLGHVPVLLFTVGLAVRTTAELLLAVSAGRGRALAMSIPSAEALEIAVAWGHFATGVGLLLAIAALLADLQRTRTMPAGMPRTTSDMDDGSFSALWIAPILFLASKGIIEAGMALPEVRGWVEGASLRVLLLHAFLLGAVSTGLVAAALDHRTANRSASSTERLWAWGFTASVVVLLMAMIPLTGLWPAGAHGPWSLQAAAIAGLGPVAFGVGMLVVAGKASVASSRRAP